MRFDVILPSQAYDWGYAEGRRNAVYATSNRDIALAFALEPSLMRRGTTGV